MKAFLITEREVSGTEDLWAVMIEASFIIRVLLILYCVLSL